MFYIFQEGENRNLSNLSRVFCNQLKGELHKVFPHGLQAGVLIFCTTRVAKAALLKALAENEDIDSVLASSSPQLPIMSGPAVLDLHQPLIVKIDARASNRR